MKEKEAQLQAIADIKAELEKTGKEYITRKSFSLWFRASKIKTIKL